MAEVDNRGCRSSKDKACKARFPRETYSETAIDPDSGALLMKKGEAWLNTFTPAVTYLMQCNYDVTSLLSGTAIKSVIAYVADYITKTPLKTHVMFQSIQQIFERNVQLLGSHKTKKDKARSLITKIVNSLTAASEIGGPMASMYLLKHPDHYTSHNFKSFYWKSFVYEVARAWSDTTPIIEPGKSTVVLRLDSDNQTCQQKVVAISPVIDYMYRPVEFENMCVYDWIRMSVKKRMPKQKRLQIKPNHLVDPIDQDDYEDDTDFETNYKVDESIPKIKGGGVPKYEEEEESDDELLLTAKSNQDLNNSISQSQIKTTVQKHKNFFFTDDHPQSKTHYVSLLESEAAYVPNFIGGSLPCKDAGSTEQYSLTMLTLFKPWCHGHSLKLTQDCSWSDTFKQHSFTLRQNEIMKFFHIRYECNDARDDFSAKKNKQTRELKVHFIYEMKILMIFRLRHFMTMVRFVKKNEKRK